ncbi:MAG: TolC family protein [Flavobacteriales bacterium]|nr:TolC family protein [Flavobacteriales bacterium]
MRKLTLFFSLWFSISVWGQTDSTTSYLSFDQCMKLVTENHPLVTKADIQLLYGDAAVLKAKGEFDPKLSTNVYQKYFDDKKYYSLLDGGLKVPTWFGPEFKMGYESNEGVFLNDQNTLPTGGLLYAGISVPIGEGLIMNQRRAELKKAKLYRESTGMKQQLMLNELMLEAGIAYWSWYNTYRQLQIDQNAVNTAKDRFEAVQQSALFGDKPSIDTVEAGIQLKSRIVQLQESEMRFRNATQLLSVHLWSPEAIPLEISENTIPAVMESNDGIPVDSTYFGQVDTLLSQHPELLIYGNKIDQLEVERRWNLEQLKPTLNLNYNPITQAVGGDILDNYSVNNYTWGLQFNMPLLLRKERGMLNKTNIQIQETKLDQQMKETQLIYKALTALNEWSTSFQQLNTYQELVQSSEQLLEGEQLLFDAGESSLFMVNSRELSLIKAQKKMAELMTKNRMAELKARYTFGVLHLDSFPLN